MKRRHWIALVSISGGVLAHFAVLTILRIQDPLVRDPFPPQAPVLFAGRPADSATVALQDQAELLDSAPLFMPTRWNSASRMDEVASLREATEIFQPFAARLRLPTVRLDLSPSLLPPQGNQSFLPSGPAFLLSGFGQGPRSFPEVAQSAPAFRVERLVNGSVGEVFTTELPGSLAAQSPPVLWSPVQVFLHVAGGRPAGPAFLAESSGFAEWDESLQSFATSLAFYGRLGDGYYRLSVLP